MHVLKSTRQAADYSLSLVGIISFSQIYQRLFDHTVAIDCKMFVKMEEIRFLQFIVRKYETRALLWLCTTSRPAILGIRMNIAQIWGARFRQCGRNGFLRILMSFVRLFCFFLDRPLPVPPRCQHNGCEWNRNNEENPKILGPSHMAIMHVRIEIEKVHTKQGL